MPKKPSKGYITDAKLMVLYVLLKYSDANHTLEKNRLLELITSEFGKSRSINVRTLDRNLETIKKFLDHKSDLFGKCKYDVISAKTGNGNTKTNIRIEHIFSDHELRYLIDMVSSCEYIVKKERVELINKLLTLTLKGFLSDYKPYLLNKTTKPKVMVNELMRNLKVIHEAIICKKQIRFVRLSRTLDGKLLNEKDENGNEKTYIVNPYRTVFNDGFYYLVCSRAYADKEPDRISNYRIDRMSEIEIIGDSVYYPESRIADVTINADTKKYISTHRMMWSGKTETILFRCPEWAITEIVDFFGDDYRILSHDKQEASLTVAVESTFDNMLIWARRFFDFVEVISPRSLRQRLKEDIARAYEKYSKDV